VRNTPFLLGVSRTASRLDDWRIDWRIGWRPRPCAGFMTNSDKTNKTVPKAKTNAGVLIDWSPLYTVGIAGSPPITDTANGDRAYTEKMEFRRRRGFARESRRARQPGLSTLTHDRALLTEARRVSEGECQPVLHRLIPIEFPSFARPSLTRRATI